MNLSKYELLSKITVMCRPTVDTEGCYIIELIYYYRIGQCNRSMYRTGQFNVSIIISNKQYFNFFLNKYF